MTIKPIIVRHKKKWQKIVIVKYLLLISEEITSQFKVPHTSLKFNLFIHLEIRVTYGNRIYYW